MSASATGATTIGETAAAVTVKSAAASFFIECILLLARPAVIIAPADSRCRDFAVCLDRLGGFCQ
jgi:hypothetical protein